MTSTENLWWRALKNYWSDPTNVIGPPGALVRRLFKFTWLVLSIYILIWVAAPLQIASWQLWMTNDDLAARVGWSFTIASALGFAIVRYAAEATDPIKVPVFLPTLRGWRDWRTAHLHLPVPTVMVGAVMVGALFAISLLGLWNLYLHEQQTTGGASVAAVSSSTSRVSEAETALAAGMAAYQAADRQYGEEIARTPASYATARSRLMNERREAANDWRSERARLEAELRTARAATVETHQTFSDPRPVDAQVAGATGLERPLTASVLDLFRSAVVELLLVMGAALGLIGATSRVGVPSNEETVNVTRENQGGKHDPEFVRETEPAPEEPPQPPVRRRFTLPHAIPADLEAAVAMGPLQWQAAEAEPVAEPETADEIPADEATGVAGVAGEVDPLEAEHAANAAARAAETNEMENA